jgi:ectoine hydroxylase-related dioxygenase (phytanoyl-CoA dioxygenase family)
VGVFLSPVRSEFAGNFTVWPGSHHRLERHFREHGLETLSNGMPDIPLGPPIQLMVEAGDVGLCHYQLAHAVAANLSTADRYALYFRLELADINQRRWELMTDIWQGWRI